MALIGRFVESYEQVCRACGPKVDDDGDRPTRKSGLREAKRGRTGQRETKRPKA